MDVSTLLKKIIRLIAEASGWLLTVVMTILVINIISRIIFHPIKGLTALSVLVAVTVIYLGIAHTEQVKRHIRVSAITSRLAPKLRAAFDLFSYTIGLFTFAVVIYAVGKNAMDSLHIHESIAGATPFPIYPVKGIIFFSCIFYWIQILYNFLDELKSYKKLK